jgi:hypothetical protein
MRTSLGKVLQDLLYHGMEKFGKYYGSYRGFVFNRDDPKQYGRLQLMIPHIYGEQAYKYWAWPVGQYSGMGYGMQFIPKVSEMVFVEFEGGDPRKPLWKHGHFGKNDAGLNQIPPELRDPDVYWFKTPGGLGFSLNDKTKEIKIYAGEVLHQSLQHTFIVGKNKIELTDTGLNVVVEDPSKIYFNGKFAVLYAKNSGTEEILDLKEIGVSKSVRVG